MITNILRWSLTITHIPTGINVSTDSNCFRSQHLARNSLISRLKSKLWVMQNDHNIINKYVYNIGDFEFVEDLIEYKEKDSE